MVTNRELKAIRREMYSEEGNEFFDKCKEARKLYNKAFRTALYLDKYDTRNNNACSDICNDAVYDAMYMKYELGYDYETTPIQKGVIFGLAAVALAEVTKVIVKKHKKRKEESQ